MSAKRRVQVVSTVKAIKEDAESANANDELDDMSDLTIKQINTEEPTDSSPIFVELLINGVQVRTEFDTGSQFSLISRSICQKIGGPALEKSPNLLAFGGHQIQRIGACEVEVAYSDKVRRLHVVVVAENDCALFGREWIIEFGMMPVLHIKQKSNSTILNDILQEYADVFKKELGRILHSKAHLYVKSDAKFRIFKPRPVRLALKSKIEDDLLRLQKLTLLEPIDHSEFGMTQIVPVMKPNNAVRICGDFKVTINQYLDVQQYPLPTISI